MTKVLLGYLQGQNKIKCSFQNFPTLSDQNKESP